MTLAELADLQGRALEVQHAARASLEALGALHGFKPWALERWRYVGRIDNRLAWFERRAKHNEPAGAPRELHIADDGSVWAEHGETWRLMAAKEVRRVLFQGM